MLNDSREDIYNAALGYIIGLLASLLLVNNIVSTGASIGFFRGIWLAFRLAFWVIFEELVFRKLSFYIFRRYTNFTLWGMYITSSLLFAASHRYAWTNIWFFLSAFIAGLYFFHLYITTSSIELPCVMHLFNNLLSTLFISSRIAVNTALCTPLYITDGVSSFKIFLTVLIELYLSVVFLEKRFIRIRGKFV